MCTTDNNCNNIDIQYYLYIIKQKIKKPKLCITVQLNTPDIFRTSTVNNYYYMYHFAWCYFFSCFLLKRGFHAKLGLNKESYSMAMVLGSLMIIRVYNARMTTWQARLTIVYI